MEVNDPDFNAFESEDSQSSKIPNLRPNAPVPESMGISSYNNAPRESQCCTSSHKQSDSDESPEESEKIFKNLQNGSFKGIFSLVQTDGAHCTDETYEAEVRAVVEQQYLSKVPVPIQHMASFYHSVVEPDRDVLK